MRTRSLLLLTATIIIAFALATISGGAGRSKSTRLPPAVGSPQGRGALDPPGTINGAVNSELIPDKTAYLMMLRLVAGTPEKQNDRFRNQSRAYLKGMGLDAEDIEVLLELADEFRGSITPIDDQAKATVALENGKPSQRSSEAQRVLDELQKQKDVILTGTINNLQRRLNPVGLLRVHQYVTTEVKRKTKIFPDPLAKSK